MALLMLLALLMTPAALCAGGQDDKIAVRSDMPSCVVEYEAHYQRLDGNGQYPFGLRPDFPGIQTDLCVMFFGRTGAGKSRLIERLVRARPGEISGRPTLTPEIYERELDNALLYVADSVWSGDNARADFSSELNSLVELRNQILKAAIPVKRIYYVVDISDGDGLVSIRHHLGLLKVALGPEAAAQIRLIVNKCDLVSCSGREFFEDYGARLVHLFNDIFEGSSPAILFVSAEECVGQLYDDISLAATQPDILLSSDDPSHPIIQLAGPFSSPGSMAEPSLNSPRHPDCSRSPTAEAALRPCPPDLTDCDQAEDGDEGESCAADELDPDQTSITSCDHDAEPLLNKDPAKSAYPEPISLPEYSGRQALGLEEEARQTATNGVRQLGAPYPGSGRFDPWLSVDFLLSRCFASFFFAIFLRTGFCLKIRS